MVQVKLIAGYVKAPIEGTWQWTKTAAKQTGHVVHATPNWTARRFDPKIDSEIMVEIGERKVLEIRKHWMASWWALARVGIATTILILLFAWAPTTWYGWVGWFAVVWYVILLSIRATWRIMEHYRDRFVITNQRIFRVDGVIGSDTAMIPKQRVTDITVKQSWIGRLCNYGHFIFESAGQVQGLDEIRYVSDPKQKRRVLLIAMNGANPDSLVMNPAEGNPDGGDGT